ncbi:MAG: CHAT domain-containing protein, partial [Planctomycetaceae bacterium]
MSVPVLVVEFTKQTAETVRALFWVGNRLEGQTRVLSLGEIAELTAKAAWYDVGLGETELRGLGARLYRWLDGDDRLLTNLLEGLPGRPAVVSLAIVAGETGLGSLPWELLHDGAEWCHARPSLALVPVRCSRRPPDAKTAQSAKETSPPANRPLSLLFMAASPQETSQRLLDYEREEALTLEATDQIGAIELRVEESGNLDELANLWQLVSATPPDVLHLTGHGDHQNNVPYLAFETLEGTLDPVTAPRLLHKGLDPLPKLAFLSSCRTGQATGVTSGSSLAEQLVQEGWPAVLGWANTVGDPQATRAAHTLYGELEQGKALPLALRSTWVELREKKAKDWHRLRLHCQETIPGPLVTPRGTAGRVFPGRVIEDEFLDPITRQSKVASRLAYVGRRTLTQPAVRQRRPQRATLVALLLLGPGGRGKS